MTKLKSIDKQEIKKVTFSGLIINIVLSIVKIVAGYSGKSQAVIADGVHSISDCITDIAVIVGSYYWSAPPDQTHPHGHRRIETVITFFIGISLIAVAAGMGLNAVTTFFDEDDPPRWVAFFAAIVSIIIKEALYQWTFKAGKKMNSSAVMANAWHHRSDAISSIPASLAVIISIFLPDNNYIDNIGAIVVCLFIFRASFKIIMPALKELVDTGAGEQLCISIENIARNVEGVKDIHKCRTRYLGNGIQVDLHVLVDPGISVREGHDISDVVKEELLNRNLNIIDVIVHIEPFEK